MAVDVIPPTIIGGTYPRGNRPLMGPGTCLPPMFLRTAERPGIGAVSNQRGATIVIPGYIRGSGGVSFTNRVESQGRAATTPDAEPFGRRSEIAASCPLAQKPWREGHREFFDDPARTTEVAVHRFDEGRVCRTNPFEVETGTTFDLASPANGVAPGPYSALLAPGVAPESESLIT